MHRSAAHSLKPLSGKREEGVVLLEALIAILIFSIGILGTIALQAAMTRAAAEARYRTEATFVMQRRVADMWIDQENLASYAETRTDIASGSGLPNGTRTTTRGEADCDSGDLSCFKITVSWQQPGSTDEHQVTTVARITGGL